MRTPDKKSRPAECSGEAGQSYLYIESLACKIQSGRLAIGYIPGEIVKLSAISRPRLAGEAGEGLPRHATIEGSADATTQSIQTYGLWIMSERPVGDWKIADSSTTLEVGKTAWINKGASWRRRHTSGRDLGWRGMRRRWNGSRADPIWMCGIWDTNKSEKVEHRVIYPRRGNGLAGSGAKRYSRGGGTDILEAEASREDPKDDAMGMERKTRMGVKIRRKGEGGKVKNIGVNQNSPHTPERSTDPSTSIHSQHRVKTNATLSLWRVSHAVRRGPRRPERRRDLVSKQAQETLGIDSTVDGEPRRCQRLPAAQESSTGRSHRASSSWKSEEEDVFQREGILPAREEKDKKRA
ncbi:hypothetical protein C8J57DRAFT_1258745 [Mycena rebaudengoi]|nr:hypothetical protein C8J57DRAFT_1258745 [Mycena rebaudengoi]